MTLQEAYVLGLEDGIRAYSWMKDGVSYVGTTGRTLGQALEAARSGIYPATAQLTITPDEVTLPRQVAQALFEFLGERPHGDDYEREYPWFVALADALGEHVPQWMRDKAERYAISQWPVDLPGRDAA